MLDDEIAGFFIEKGIPATVRHLAGHRTGVLVQGDGEEDRPLLARL